MLERLNNIEQRYKELETELMNEEVLKDVRKTKELSIERSSIEEVYNTYQEYKKILNDIEEAKEMIHDKELGEMAKEELEEKEKLKEEYDSKFQILLLPKDPNDSKNVIVEIRGAAGGDEGNIFAGDLFDMYKYYAIKEGWTIEVMEESPGVSGGYALISFMIKGNNVYSKMKYESGAHRVQRVPATESKGRIHTSVATVLVMPEATEIDFKLDMNDIRVDTFCSSGPGGQGVNTTYSAVRVTHIPTGMFVACQTYRSQHENKAAALQLLTTRLYDQLVREKEEAEGAERHSLVGKGDRSEKIRTYNWPDNRVTDHRIGLTLNRLDAIIEGKLDLVIEELINEDQKRKLAQEDSIRL